MISESVTVRQMRLRSQDRHQAPLLAGLDDIRWPAADSREYLLLRRVQVRAPWWQAAEQAGQQARRLALRAVSGWSAAAPHADAVRFADLADLLACLGRDLADGRAAGLWFWQGWQPDPPVQGGDAISTVWRAHPLQLPDIIDRLLARRALPAVCDSLQAPGIDALLAAVRHATGWPLPTPTPGSIHPPAPATLPEPALARWRPVVGALATDRLAGLVPLIALIEAWRQMPERLAQATTWIAWQQVIAEQLDAPRHRDLRARFVDADMPQAIPTTSGPVPRAAAGRSPRPGDKRSADAAPALPRKGDHTDAMRAGGRTPATSAAAPDAVAGSVPRAPTVRRRTAQTAKGAGAVATAAPHDDAAPAAPADGFHTDQGGLFYLLNTLNHPAAAGILDAADESGWHRLYRLGRHLGLVCDVPLAGFLAAQLDLDDPARLDDLPPLSAEAALCRLVDRQFGHLSCWGPQLLQLPAVAMPTRSHLDLYYRLDSVRLEVRRAGLDIDPGWLPWLGRVVHFHYADTLRDVSDGALP